MRLEGLKKLVIETVTYCNASCNMCPRSYMRREGIMPMWLFEDILEGCSGSDISEISLTGYGEPLCDTYLEDRVALSKLAFPGARVGFFTNGSLMSKSRAMSLLVSGLDWVAFSIDSPDADVERNIRGLDLKKVRENYEGFLKVRSDITANCSVRVHSVVQSINEDVLGGSVQRAFPGADTYTVTYCDGRGAPHSLREFFDLSTPFGCHDVESALFVLVDGDIVMCCQDWDGKYPIGNVRDGLSEVWNSKKFQAIREAHRTGRKWEIPLCKACKTRY